MNGIRNIFIEHHIWFCNHSCDYIAIGGKYKNKDIRYFPMAWLKFMYYSFLPLIKEKISKSK